jgi:hypothetical protein
MDEPRATSGSNVFTDSLELIRIVVMAVLLEGLNCAGALTAQTKTQRTEMCRVVRRSAKMDFLEHPEVGILRAESVGPGFIVPGPWKLPIKL